MNTNTRTLPAGALLIGLAFLAGCGSGRAERPSGLAPEEDGGGATRTVEADERQFVETVQEMLQGKVAGLQVMDHPACGLTIRIRGMSDSLLGWDSESNQSVAECDREPLLIIDNKPVAPGGLVNALESLRPSDIERIRVLKDVSSTSVYGSRGAYGVILVTTTQ